MQAVITADIANSRNKNLNWMQPLQQTLQRFGNSPENWDIFRGDSFQIHLTDASVAFWTCLYIKAALLAHKTQVRMAIGLGDVNSEKEITLRNGSAFIHSGDAFENLKPQKRKWAIQSDNPEFDANLNLILDFSSALIENWQTVSAEFVQLSLENPDDRQLELGKKLGINQAAVSRRRSRSNLDLLLDADKYYRNQISQLP